MTPSVSRPTSELVSCTWKFLHTRTAGLSLSLRVCLLCISNLQVVGGGGGGGIHVVVTVVASVLFVVVIVVPVVASVLYCCHCFLF